MHWFCLTNFRCTKFGLRVVCASMPWWALSGLANGYWQPSKTEGRRCRWAPKNWAQTRLSWIEPERDSNFSCLEFCDILLLLEISELAHRHCFSSANNRILGRDLRRETHQTMNPTRHPNEICMPKICISWYLAVQCRPLGSSKCMNNCEGLGRPLFVALMGELVGRKRGEELALLLWRQDRGKMGGPVLYDTSQHRLTLSLDLSPIKECPVNRLALFSRFGLGIGP